MTGFVIVWVDLEEVVGRQVTLADPSLRVVYCPFAVYLFLMLAWFRCIAVTWLGWLAAGPAKGWADV